MRKPISQRIIAGILLLNYSLMSCYTPTIEPSKETAKVLVIAIHQERRQLDKIENSEVYELPIVPYVETVMQGNFDEESIQTVQPRPIQLDSRRDQLRIPLVSKENTPTPVQSAVDNKHQAVKQTHQPILSLPSRTQLPLMIIYPSNQSTDITKDQQHVPGKEKHQRMQQLEPVQHNLSRTARIACQHRTDLAKSYLETICTK